MGLFFAQMRQFFRLLKRENIPRLLLLTVFSIIIGTLGLWLFERAYNSNVTSLLDAIWWSFVTVTTVGYGDISPITLGGRITAVIVMLLGIGFLGMFTATIASVFVEHKLKEERGLKKVNITNHTILCGWNHRAEAVFQEIRSDKVLQDTKIVLIADIDAKPLDDDSFFFVKGDVTEENLRRANLEKAKNVIIVADDRLDPRSRDAKTILNTLTVESINPNVYTCVEIEDASNANYCRRAKADEIIISGEFSSKMLALAALHHGISKLIDELLSSRYGSNLYKYKVPASFVGQKFIDIFLKAKSDYNCTIVAIESESEKIFISNPPADYQIKPDDFLIIIASQKPEF